MKKAKSQTTPDSLDLVPLWDRVPAKLRDNMQIGLLLDDNARLQLSVLTHRMKKYDVTYKQWYALSQISRKNGMTQTEIGELLGVTKGACTTLLDRLIGGGWIERKQAEGDRRQQRIYLTDKGRNLIEQEVDILSETYVEVFGALSNSEKRQLIANLAAIRDMWATILQRERALD